jgi:hypothetical protein
MVITFMFPWPQREPSLPVTTRTALGVLTTKKDRHARATGKLPVLIYRRPPSMTMHKSELISMITWRPVRISYFSVHDTLQNFTGDADG